MGAVSVHLSRPSPHVVLLELDNPPMNALGREPRAQMLAHLDAIAADGSVRAAVLTGRGRAFCSGDDLKEQADAQKAQSTAHLAVFGEVLERIENLRVPVIAAVNGHSLGGGMELACVCDIRIASTAARFTCSGVNIGLMASAWRLPRLIGLGRAKHMLFTGLAIDAGTAERFGLVTGVHAPDDLLAEALKLAERIASRAPLSVEAVKRVASRALDLSPQEGAALHAGEIGALARSADHQEALAAFGQKREPDFKRE